MTAQRPSSVGECPDCHESIPSRAVLITYETSDGTAQYASCPCCGDVVSPV